MAALDTKSLDIQRSALFMPELNEVAEVLSKGLMKNFSEVNVEVVDCPNLKEKPFTLECSGLNGHPQLFDIGGVPYLIPLVNKEKNYDVLEVCKSADIDPLYVIGAGAGPWSYLGANCEGIFNMSIVNGKVNQQTRIASVSPHLADKGVGKCKLEILPQNETKFSILANIFVSEGKPGKVLRVECKKRTGEDDFITAIRKSLKSKYDDKSVGLGGTFLLKEGRAKEHIMPDFSKTPLNSDGDVNEWLHFFDMSAPLINVGTLLSHDPGLDLRIQHFHTFSHHGEGGHYHIDTTPDTAHYVGYFNLAERIIRVDAPKYTHNFGRD